MKRQRNVSPSDDKQPDPNEAYDVVPMKPEPHGPPAEKKAHEK